MVLSGWRRRRRKSPNSPSSNSSEDTGDTGKVTHYQDHHHSRHHRLHGQQTQNSRSSSSSSSLSSLISIVIMIVIMICRIGMLPTTTFVEPELQTLGTKTQEEDGDSSVALSSTSLTEKLQLDHNLYRQVYDTYQSQRLVMPQRQLQSYPSTPRNSMLYNNFPNLSSYTNSEILSKSCTMTVVLMDPRISILSKGASAYFALESVAAYLPSNRTCVVLQTSKCNFIPNQNRKKKKNDIKPKLVEQQVYYHLYDNSLPLFRQMILNGQVRVTFLNHSQYHLKSCDNFFNPSAALMSKKYWTNEFIDDIDSDTILVIQNDAVLCQPLNTLNLLEKYRHYAYVGAVWKDNECNLMKDHWDSYTMGTTTTNRKHVLPEFPTMCNIDNQKNGIAPLGNGGFSLRSRKAMIQVIESCPHTLWSGITFDGDEGSRYPSLFDNDLNCSVSTINEDNNNNTMIGNGNRNNSAIAMQEDIYFGTILRAATAANNSGITLPTAYEASLFAVEMMWPEQSLVLYGGSSSAERAYLLGEAIKIAQRLDSTQGLAKDKVIPIGFHQPFRFHPKEVLLSKHVLDQCPLLEYIYDPLDRRNYKRKIRVMSRIRNVLFKYNLL